MDKRANIIKRKYDRIRHKRIRQFAAPYPIMPKDIEKEIILDAISSFILSCDAKQADDFIKSVRRSIELSMMP